MAVTTSVNSEIVIMQAVNNLFSEYEKLAEKADKVVERLEKLHRPHMECRLGCSYCCMDYSIFPVEYYAILNHVKKTEVRFNPSGSPEECVFLVNNACMIYAHRPVICRTHGLPLLYTNEDGEWEMSACELNFTSFEDDFHAKNTFPQDRFNSELFMLNKEFVSGKEFSHFAEFDLLPLKSMKDELLTARQNQGK